MKAPEMMEVEAAVEVVEAMTKSLVTDKIREW